MGLATWQAVAAAPGTDRHGHRTPRVLMSGRETAVDTTTIADWAISEAHGAQDALSWKGRVERGEVAG